MTFKEYLAIRRVTDTPAGDFTKDARADRHLPNVKTWEQLRRHVERRAPLRNGGDVLSAARQVWAGYQRKQQQLG